MGVTRFLILWSKILSETIALVEYFDVDYDNDSEYEYGEEDLENQSIEEDTTVKFHLERNVLRQNLNVQNSSWRSHLCESQVMLTWWN